MIVLVKSSPDTADGQRGVSLARDLAADLVLLQNGVYFARQKKLGAFSGTVYVLVDDTRLRGIQDAELKPGVKAIDYDRLVDLVIADDKVMGMF